MDRETDGNPAMIFKAEINDSTVEITLLHNQGKWRGETLVPVAKWASVLPDQRLPLLAVLEGLVDTYCGTRSVDSVTLPHEAIVSLTDSQATAFGLPSAVPLALDLRLNGLIHQADSYVSTAWVTAGGIRELVTRKGAFLYKGRDLYRIPSPLYELVIAAERLKRDNAASDAERYTAFAALNEAMPEDGANQKVRLDSALCSIRILHASSFSLQIPTDGEAFDFHPILFSRKSTGRAEEDKRILDEAENLLTPALQETFTEKRFRRYGVARECYPIDDGVYVYLDPDLQKALTVVRQKQAASPEERKAFIHAPQRFIRDQIGDDLDEDQISSIFVETEQYAHNVIGLGIWSPPVIPWLVREPNNWLPEKFGLKIGEDYIQIKPEDVPCAINEIRTRLEDYAGLAENPSPYECEGADGIKVQIPVTKEALDALEGMTGLATAMIHAREEKQASGEVSSKTQEEAQKASGPIFLLVDDNLNDVTYQRNPQRRAGQSDYTHPINLKASLKDHQEIGVRWIIDAWTQGAPGVLLADDMGLGKTLQALTFLAWIIERKKTSTKCREPILIIAPTGLLKNWRKEIETHLREPQLGRICEAYGKSLSLLRREDSYQNDTEAGSNQLSRVNLRQEYDVILTTYETYRDYHHSFAGIRFSAVVMDECQKIKNPKSQVNRALASMNPEFVIAMTGTPIENAIEDLWTIVDRVWPGFLGGLKAFSSTYSPENHASLQELTLKLKSASAAPHVTSPILLRRMKNGILTDFPMKILHIDDCKADMPREQADAYSQAVMRAREANPPPILFTLHALRGISLHPIDPSLILREGSFDSYDAYVRSSARLSQTIRILDHVQRKNEKALLFIETLDMQELMAVILKKRYGLKQRPGIINGKTGVEKIQKLVDAFESDFNFDVMILSPKVGGVGLTLVSANHVIHLSRWWNPAVEDQSTDRAYRIGQKKDVHVYYPMAIHPDTNFRESSFDLNLEKLLARKRQLSQDMLIPPESLEDASTLFEDTVGAHTDPCTITLSELDAMEPTVFERWVLNRAAQNGYIINATQDAWDHGADGIIQHKDTEASFILQCKHSARDQMSEDKAIGDLLRARTKYGIDSLVALTNRHFSPAVVQRMNQLGIRYFDRETIAQWPNGL